MASGNDIKAAEKTYEGFIGLLKWSVPLVAAITAIVVTIIAT
ncbi:MAG: aa3-type cytochrome c oxidase subunit IV [Sphingomonadaceae bacterium]